MIEQFISIIILITAFLLTVLVFVFGCVSFISGIVLINNNDWKFGKKVLGFVIDLFGFPINKEYENGWLILLFLGILSFGVSLALFF